MECQVPRTSAESSSEALHPRELAVPDCCVKGRGETAKRNLGRWTLAAGSVRSAFKERSFFRIWPKLHQPSLKVWWSNELELPPALVAGVQDIVMAKFFAEPKAQKKRKRENAGASNLAKRHRTDGVPTRSRPRTRKPQRDESISGSESDDSEGGRLRDDDAEAPRGDSDSEAETGAEKRLRLAEQYLEKVRNEVTAEGGDLADLEDELVEKRLHEDVAEAKGRMYRTIAASFDYDAATSYVFRAPPKCVTAVAACDPYVYTAAKDGSMTKWEIPATESASESSEKKRKARAKPPRPQPRRPVKLATTPSSHAPPTGPSKPHHTAAILCIAASGDGRFVATGGADRRLIVWTAADLSPIRAFNQHRDAVTGLAFRRGTNQLYSSSADRTIKTWDLDAMGYVETLFGHQDQVLDVAALAPERCLTAGARDRTVRLWKVAEETQLVFRASAAKGERERHLPRQGGAPPPALAEGSIERVAFVDDETFVSGSDNGALALWSIRLKKPTFVVSAAHGLDPPPRPEQYFAETELEGRRVPAPPLPRWITALKAIPYSDLLLSGSWDGQVRVWRVTEDKKRLECLSSIRLKSSNVDTDMAVEGGSDEKTTVLGMINSIDVLERGKRGAERLCVVAALGRAHRLGRWKITSGRSGAVMFDVTLRESNGDGALARDRTSPAIAT